jgi:hypothetical protein
MNTPQMVSVSAFCWTDLARHELDAVINGDYDGEISDIDVLTLIVAQLNNAVKDAEAALSLAKEAGR